MRAQQKQYDDQSPDEREPILESLERTYDALVPKAEMILEEVATYACSQTDREGKHSEFSRNRLLRALEDLISKAIDTAEST